MMDNSKLHEFSNVSTLSSVTANYDTAIDDTDASIYYSINSSRDISNITISADNNDELEVTLEPQNEIESDGPACVQSVADMFKSKFGVLSSTPTHKTANQLELATNEDCVTLQIPTITVTSADDSVLEEPKAEEKLPVPSATNTNAVDIQLSENLTLDEISEANETDNNDSKVTVIEKKMDSVIEADSKESDKKIYKITEELIEAQSSNMDTNVNNLAEVPAKDSLISSLKPGIDNAKKDDKQKRKTIFDVKDNKENSRGTAVVSSLINKIKKKFNAVESPRTRRSVLVKKSEISTRKSFLQPMRNAENTVKSVRNRVSLLPAANSPKPLKRLSTATATNQAPAIKRSLADIQEVALKRRTMTAQAAVRRSVMPVSAGPRIARPVVPKVTLGSQSVKSSNDITCEVCNKVFGTQGSLLTHKRSHSSFKCTYCGKSFTKKPALDTHYKMNCDKIPVSARRLLETPPKVLTTRSVANRVTPNKNPNDAPSRPVSHQKPLSGIKRTINKPILCLCCNTNFSNVIAYAEHESNKNKVKTAIIFDNVAE